MNLDIQTSALADLRADIVGGVASSARAPTEKPAANWSTATERSRAVTNKRENEGMSVAAVTLHLWRGAYQIHNLDVVKTGVVHTYLAIWVRAYVNRKLSEIHGYRADVFVAIVVEWRRAGAVLFGATHRF
jgi:hypothetical protein